MKFRKLEAGKYIAIGHNRPEQIQISKTLEGFWRFNNGFSEIQNLMTAKLYEAKFEIEQMCKADKCAG